jgi:signal transduction histidine kinase
MVIALAAAVSAVPAQTDFERLEAELEQASGSERVELLNRLAETDRTNDPLRAIEYGTQALALADDLGDEVAQARALKSIGIGRYLLADYPEALENYRYSLAIAERLGDEQIIADVLNNIGVLYYVWGEYDEALAYYTRVLELRRGLGDRRGMGVIYNNLGNIHYATGRYEEALDYLYEAHKIYEDVGEDRLAASTLNNVGLALIKLERLDEALETLQTALAIEERLGDLSGVALSLNTIGMVHQNLGNETDSLDHYRRSLEIRREIGDRQGIAICLHNIGQLYVESGEASRALAYLEEALETAESIDVKEIQRDVWLSLSGTHERLKDPASALAAYKRYKQINDELFSQETSRRLAEQQTRYDVEKKDREIEMLRQKEENQRTMRNVLLAGAGLLILIILLLYNRYRLRVRANLEMRKANEALKLAQEEREKAMRAELTHVTRMATLGELAAALAHELNQPMTAILSNAQATRRMLAAGQDAATIDEALGDIVEGSGRAREIIQRLRALIRRGEVALEAHDLNRVLMEIEPIARVDTERNGVELVLKLADDLPRILGDRIQLQQVVLNLVHNGTEAMSGVAAEDGRIEIETAADEAGNVRVTVRDTGPGLDDETLAGIFRPFFTTKPDGLGMGLTICATIVDAHGGTIVASRNPDRGLTVTFTVPAATKEPAA